MNMLESNNDNEIFLMIHRYIYSALRLFVQGTFSNPRGGRSSGGVSPKIDYEMGRDVRLRCQKST